MTDHILMAGKKTVGLHFKGFFFELHHKWRPQVDQISITNVWEKRIGKALRIFSIEFFKISLPEKIDELRKRFPWLSAMIPELKMVFMKKFYVLHAIKLGLDGCSDDPESAAVRIFTFLLNSASQPSSSGSMNLSSCLLT